MELNQLTLAEIEALAERLGAAVKTIRDAQALLGGGGAPRMMISTPVGMSVPAAVASNQAAIFFSPSEQAERAKLLQQFKPEDVEAIERP